METARKELLPSLLEVQTFHSHASESVNPSPSNSNPQLEGFTDGLYQVLYTAYNEPSPHYGALFMQHMHAFTHCYSAVGQREGGGGWGWGVLTAPVQYTQALVVFTSVFQANQLDPSVVALGVHLSEVLECQVRGHICLVVMFFA